jgi:hypothetical protein
MLLHLAHMGNLLSRYYATCAEFQIKQMYFEQFIPCHILQCRVLAGVAWPAFAAAPGFSFQGAKKNKHFKRKRNIFWVHKF